MNSEEGYLLVISCYIASKDDPHKQAKTNKRWYILFSPVASNEIITCMKNCHKANEKKKKIALNNPN